MGWHVPAAVTQVNATEEGDSLVDYDALLMMRPEAEPIRVAKNLQQETTRFTFNKVKYNISSFTDD